MSSTKEKIWKSLFGFEPKLCCFVIGTDSGRLNCEIRSKFNIVYYKRKKNVKYFENFSTLVIKIVINKNILDTINSNFLKGGELNKEPNEELEQIKNKINEIIHSYKTVEKICFYVNSDTFGSQYVQREVIDTYFYNYAKCNFYAQYS